MQADLCSPEADEHSNLRAPMTRRGETREWRIWAIRWGANACFSVLFLPKLELLKDFSLFEAFKHVSNAFESNVWLKNASFCIRLYPTVTVIIEPKLLPTRMNANKVFSIGAFDQNISIKWPSPYY